MTEPRLLWEGTGIVGNQTRDCMTGDASPRPANGHQLSPGSIDITLLDGSVFASFGCSVTAIESSCFHRLEGKGWRKNR